MGLGDFVSFDPSIVRGLAYYTGTVFEVFDRKGEFRAVCGGGRYDNLLRVVSGIDLPALGFGMGDVVLTELLADRGLLPGYRPRVDVYLIAVTEEDRPTVLRLAHQLRDAGYSTLYALRPMSVGKQFKDADTRGAARVLVVGPEEREQGVVMVRVMETGEEKRVPMDEVLR